MITRRDVFCFLAGNVFLLAGLTGKAKLADVDATLDRLGHQIDTIGVRLQMSHAASSAVDDEPEFVGRRDTFDRRSSSAEKGGRP